MFLLSFSCDFRLKSAVENTKKTSPMSKYSFSHTHNFQHKLQWVSLSCWGHLRKGVYFVSEAAASASRASWQSDECRYKKSRFMGMTGLSGNELTAPPVPLPALLGRLASCSSAVTTVIESPSMVFISRNHLTAATEAAERESQYLDTHSQNPEQVLLKREKSTRQVLDVFDWCSLRSIHAYGRNIIRSGCKTFKSSWQDV